MFSNPIAVKKKKKKEAEMVYEAASGGVRYSIKLPVLSYVYNTVFQGAVPLSFYRGRWMVILIERLHFKNVVTSALLWEQTF